MRMTLDQYLSQVDPIPGVGIWVNPNNPQHDWRVGRKSLKCSVTEGWVFIPSSEMKKDGIVSRITSEERVLNSGVSPECKKHSRQNSMENSFPLGMNRSTFIFYSFLQGDGNESLRVILRSYASSSYLAYALQQLAITELFSSPATFEQAQILEEIDYLAIARRYQLEAEYDTPESWDIANDFNDKLETIGG